MIKLNRELVNRLERGNALFGEVLSQAAVPKEGPDRPNRKKLTKQEVKDIRAAYKGGVKQKDLADNYGVNRSTISRTVRGIYN